MVLLFLLPAVLNAQESEWDAALGEYQRFCDECIALRTRSAAGERIEASELASLLSRLSSLKNALQGAAGQMTPAQRLRFESIRLRYEEVFSQPGGHSPVRIPQLEPGVALRAPVKSLDDGVLGPFDHVATVQKENMALHPGIFLLAGVPDLYFGAMFTLSGLRAGAYIKASSEIPMLRHAYDCFSNGTTPDGFIWTNGELRVSHRSITAGATFTPWKFLTLYAGAGYGSHAVNWQDVSFRWARVEDLSVRGVAADAGVIINIGRFSLLAGVSSVLPGQAGAEFGAGVRF